ncbi:MAG TPA: hypothetical protein VNN98_09000 [Rhizomicrobium sp.]|nr:hypothetical protein [Rhizomicrobium sp.]
MTRQIRATSLALIILAAATAARADNSMPDMPAAPTAPPSQGQAILAKIQTLYGTWDSPATGITDIFKPFALGTAVLGEEWKGGKQITATVFYVVNGELRADHYCDYLNQPRYTAMPSSDPAMIDLEFREATNLDTHPVHFHSTQWRIVDAQHLIQDWYVVGGKKPVSLVHMEFTKRADNPA